MSGATWDFSAPLGGAPAAAAVAVDYKALKRQATALAQQQDHVQAATLNERAADAAKAAGDAEVARAGYSSHAGCLFALGQWEQALAASDKAVEADMRHWAGWANRGAALHRQGRYDDEAQTYQKALDRKPPAAGQLQAICENLQLARDEW